MCLFYAYVCFICMYVMYYVCVWYPQRPKEEVGSLGLEVQTTVGIYPRSCGRAGSALSAEPSLQTHEHSGCTLPS